LVEPEVVATSPYRIKSPVPVCCGFDSLKLACHAVARPHGPLRPPAHCVLRRGSLALAGASSEGWWASEDLHLQGSQTLDLWGLLVPAAPLAQKLASLAWLWHEPRKGLRPLLHLRKAYGGQAGPLFHRMEEREKIRRASMSVQLVFGEFQNGQGQELREERVVGFVGFAQIRVEDELAVADVGFAGGRFWPELFQPSMVTADNGLDLRRIFGKFPFHRGGQVRADLVEGEAGVLPIGCFPILHFDLRLGDALFHFFAEAVDEILLVPGLFFRVETDKHFLRFHFLFSF